MVEPFGEEPANLRAGLITSMIVNVNQKKGSNPKTASDFLLKTRAKIEAEAKMRKPDQSLSSRLKEAFTSFGKKKGR